MGHGKGADDASGELTGTATANLQSMVPIFLIVSGLAPVLFVGSASRNNEEIKCIIYISVLIALLFSTAWKVKTEGKVVCSANVTNCLYCSEVVLTFALAMVTIDRIFLGCTIVCVVCLIFTELCK
ncbi:hypothetical protein ACJMK2_009471 [Sinanodonta woodiana]|uniref:Uncharacterized protein n=1 Tax=Sinanodonta woodiana TaxID=1069815 RepID=A0ABD3VCC3_SINWO